MITKSNLFGYVDRLYRQGLSILDPSEPKGLILQQPGLFAVPQNEGSHGYILSRLSAIKF